MNSSRLCSIDEFRRRENNEVLLTNCLTEIEKKHDFSKIDQLQKALFSKSLLKVHEDGT